jgi:hypothetical protein
MSTCTQAIGQSLFDFLDGKNAFEKLDAIRNGDLGREINRYVQGQLERFHIGAFQDAHGEPLTGRSSNNLSGHGDPVVFGAAAAGEGRGDLAGPQDHLIQGHADLTANHGGVEDALVGESHPTDQIFKSHR